MSVKANKEIHFTKTITTAATPIFEDDSGNKYENVVSWVVYVPTGENTIYRGGASGASGAGIPYAAEEFASGDSRCAWFNTASSTSDVEVVLGVA